MTSNTEPVDDHAEDLGDGSMYEIAREQQRDPESKPAYEHSQLGFVSIRNEDGTQYADGRGMWGDARGKRAIMYIEFQVLEIQKAKSTENNSPDNGFFGLMNLKFHPCTPFDAEEQNQLADQFDRQMEAEDMRYANEAYAAGAPFPLPTLDQINEQSCQDVALLTLRCLASSGGHTSLYELLKPTTIDDILEQCKGLITGDPAWTQENWDSSTVLEANRLIDDIQTYSNNMQDK